MAGSLGHCLGLNLNSGWDIKTRDRIQSRGFAPFISKRHKRLLLRFAFLALLSIAQPSPDLALEGLIYPLDNSFDVLIQRPVSYLDDASGWRGIPTGSSH